MYLSGAVLIPLSCEVVSPDKPLPKSPTVRLTYSVCVLDTHKGQILVLSLAHTFLNSRIKWNFQKSCFVGDMSLVDRLRKIATYKKLTLNYTPVQIRFWLLVLINGMDHKSSADCKTI